MAKSVKRIMFSDEQVFHLIDLYELNECLWNIRCAEHKDIFKRKAAISDIAERMGVPEDLVKKKINSLRATYLMEKKKVFTSEMTGDFYSPTVPWFDRLRFLDKVIITRKATSENDLHPGNSVDVEAQTYTESDINVPYSSNNARGTPPSVSRKKSKRGDTSKTSSETTLEDLIIKKLSSIREPDMFDNFGVLIASQLRSIPMEDALELQMEIGQLVSDRLLIIHQNKKSK